MSKVVHKLSGRAVGHVDHFDSERVAGWLAPAAGSRKPATLSVHVDGRHEMNIQADLERADVHDAGVGPLFCGFDATLPRRVRDGKAHEVTLRIEPKGPIMPDGRLLVQPLAAGAPYLGATPSTPVPPAEGIGFFDSARLAIAGWAAGCGAILLKFDDETAQTVVLDRPVAGFGKGSHPGFLVPVPLHLMDNDWHQVTLTMEDGITPLDGSPVRFRAAPDHPLIALDEQIGRVLTLRLYNARGAASSHPVSLAVDGVSLISERKGGYVTVTLPEGGRVLVVSDAQGDERPIARFEITADGLERATVGDPDQDLLDPDLLTRAVDAFEQFCNNPDARFDPLWYAQSSPELAFDTALEHYRDTGAKSGRSPGPFFDESVARARHPQLVGLIGSGRLPCAFAVELVLGIGSLGSLTGLNELFQGILHGCADADAITDALTAESKKQGWDAPMPVSSQRDPIVSRLPVPTAQQDPAKGIYAAWCGRLDVSQDVRADIELDEARTRRDINSLPLAATPLVSIIMPSYNRAFTIGEAIQSALDQSYGNWELLVCDDASEDKTAEVVRRFDDPRIRYFKFSKSNGAETRNKGLGFARGDYISYLDSDNIWHPMFLDLMMRRLLSAPGSAIAYCGYLDTEIDGARVLLQAISRPTFRPIRLSGKNFMDLNTMVHHRRVYDWLGGFDNDLPRLQDWDLALRYTSVFRPLFVNRIGVFYRRNVAWGQVTHLFVTSGAQDTVNEKTEKRLTVKHEQLKISWPERRRVTVLLGSDDIRDYSVAHGLAVLAASVADVDLIIMSSADIPATDEIPGITRHYVPDALRRDPLRLGYVFGHLLSARPVLTVGMTARHLRAVAELDMRLVFRLRGSGDGVELRGLQDSKIRFYLGALPIELPEKTDAPANPVILVLPPRTDRAGRRIQNVAYQAEAANRNLTLLIPPRQGNADWQVLTRDGAKSVPSQGGFALIEDLAQCQAVACLVPISELDPFAFNLLNACQAQGVPAAVLQDSGRARATGLARQWIEARAAYEIKVNDPKWVFDKLPKLIADRAGYDRLSERSQTVQSIALHAELARERLAFALYRLLFDIPVSEVIHDER